MPDSFAEHLKRFTPAGAGLDRDALLFEAGRVSAPATRPWKALTALLTVSQLVTLWFLASRPAGYPLPAPAPPPVVEPAPAPSPRFEPLALRQRLLQGGADLPAVPAGGTFVADEPPLRALTCLEPSRID